MHVDIELEHLSIYFVCMQVYYFGLPDGWEPSQVGNDAALGLLLRLAHDGAEADGCDHVILLIYAWVTPGAGGSLKSYHQHSLDAQVL